MTYEKEGHVYSGKSGVKNFWVNPEKVETPVIEKQPQNVQHVLGKQEIIQLEIALKQGISGIRAQRQMSQRERCFQVQQMRLLTL